MKNPSKTVILAAAALAAAALAAGPVAEWDWHMPPSVYRRLEFTDRASVDRAVKIFQQAVDAESRGMKVTDIIPRYRAAKGEWKKVQIQAEGEEFDGALLGYAVFMQGYSAQCARDRNEAMSRYAEVIDLYPDQGWIVTVARYMLAKVKREMGDIRAGDADLDGIIDDRAAAASPVYQLALSDRAGSLMESKKFGEAAELWRRIVFEVKKPDARIFASARDNLISAIIGLGHFGELADAVYAGIPPGGRKERAKALVVNANWMADEGKYWSHGVTKFVAASVKNEKDRPKAGQKARREYAAWLDSQMPLLEELGMAWEGEWIRFRLAAVPGKNGVTPQMLRKLEGIIKGGKDDKARDSRVRALFGELLALRQPDLARDVADWAASRLNALWMHCDAEQNQEKWKAAMLYLEEIRGMKPPPPAEDMKRAHWAMGDICLRRTGEYDKAIKIYTEINEPPRSLWPLAEAWRASGKKQQGYSVLTEIASIFPNDAPGAVLRMAQWREQDGEKEKAVALYRRLLSQPEWKERSESSQAHQALERLGIATGGAMTNTVR